MKISNNPPDDVVSGCVEYLSQYPSLVSLLGSTVDPNTGIIIPWLFDSSLFEAVESTSSAAVVISYDGPSSNANYFNTIEYSRIRADVYVDAMRDINLAVTNPNLSRLAAKQISRQLDILLHRPDGDYMTWGTVAVNTSIKISDATPFPATDHTRLFKLSTFYAVEIAGYLV